MELHRRLLVGEPSRKRPLGDVNIDGKIALKFILEKCVVKM